MTREEARNHPDYLEAMNKIRNYRPGFKFTVHYEGIPRAKRNASRRRLQVGTYSLHPNGFFILHR